MLVKDNKIECVSISNASHNIDNDIKSLVTINQTTNELNEPFNCNGLTISTESDENDNYEDLIQNKKRKWNCTYKGCSKVYCSKENLKLHIQNIHLNLKPYPCYYCNLRFSHRNGRIYHQKKKHLSNEKLLTQHALYNKNFAKVNLKLTKEYKQKQNKMFITFKEK